jgi:hypothetical protein
VKKKKKPDSTIPSHTGPLLDWKNMYKGLTFAAFATCQQHHAGEYTNASFSSYLEKYFTIVDVVAFFSYLDICYLF